MSAALPPSDKLLAPVPPPRVPDHVSDTAIEPPALTGVPRVVRGLRSRSNWLQLVRFGLVGGSGFIVNTAVYAFCLHVLDMHYLPSAVVAFCVAVTNNFLWNRLWTFSGSGTARAHVQGVRFLAVSVTALVPNLVLLTLFVQLGLGKIPAQMLAVCLVMPITFVGNKLWTFD